MLMLTDWLIILKKKRKRRRYISAVFSVVCLYLRMLTLSHACMSLSSCCTSLKAVNSIEAPWETGLQMVPPTHLRVGSCSPSLSSSLFPPVFRTQIHINIMLKTGIEMALWNNALCCCFYYQPIDMYYTLFEHRMFPQESTLVCMCCVSMHVFMPFKLNMVVCVCFLIQKSPVSYFYVFIQYECFFNPLVYISA